MWISTAGSTSRATPTSIPRKSIHEKPVVYFGSFQDLLGRDKTGNIKPKNEWLHAVNWDLVVFDEYHFGAWRDTAKELFEGEEEAVAKKEAKLEYAAALEDVNEDLACFRRRKPSSCPSRPKPISTSPAHHSRRWPRASSSKNKSSTGPTPTNSAPRKTFAAKNPGKWNPYGALPQMRLLTYQMPDELLTVASAGEFDEFDLNEFFAATGTGKRRAVQAQERRTKMARHYPRPVHAEGWSRASRRARRRRSLIRMCGLLPYLQHSFWFLPNVAACHAMANLLAEKHNIFWHEYEVVVAAGASAGIGLDALPPVREAIGSGFDDQDNHAIMRQAHHWRNRAAMVFDPDAAQSEEP